MSVNIWNEAEQKLVQASRNAKAKPYACCNLPHIQFKGMILIWNDIYEKMSEQELQEYIKSKECIENKM